MKYHKQNIHKRLVTEDGNRQEYKIKKELDKRLHKFEAYSIPEIRRVLDEVYTLVGLDKKPVATNLSRCYRIRRIRKKGQDAIVIEGDAMMPVGL